MSVDTRTSRTPGPSGASPGEPPGGGPRGFFDDEPGLSTVKVPSDPAQVVVNHASFRVRLAPSPAPSARSAQAPPPRAPVIGGSSVRTGEGAAAGEATGQIPAAAGAAGKRRAPVVWSGRTAAGTDGEGEATELLRAVHSGAPDTATEEPGATTQVLPRVEQAPAGSGPAVAPPRSPEPSETTRPTPLLSGVRPAEGAFDEPEYESARPGRAGATTGAAADAARRQAYYPMRRMNLGVVLLPLRIFLGFISIYAGMSKLCDPVYFDGGERGSMVTWLRHLDPWTIASPLRDFALAHPVGAGLTVAFLQVIVGVLTLCGLWQRLAAGLGALLSVALLMTVSWSTVPAYDAPDFIYLAAWSPLLIAGAPVYSIDAHLASDAWRTLGPRVDVMDLRQRVLRRGAVIATVVVGLALLIGSLLGGAVRSSQAATVPGPGKPPTNQLPGSPVPGTPNGNQTRTDQGANPATGPYGQSNRRPSAGPSASASPGAAGRQRQSRQSAEPGSGQRQTVQAPQQSAPPTRETAPGTGGAQQPTDGGSSSDDSTGTSGSGSTSGTDTGGSGSSGGSSGGSGGGLGGLLGQ